MEKIQYFNNVPLLFTRFAEAPPELLETEDPRLSGAKHHDCVDLGQVHSLIENIDGEDHVQFPLVQLLERGGSRGGNWPAVDGDGTKPIFLEEIGHEISMTLGAAEC
jgi:hypothetical protein